MGDEAEVVRELLRQTRNERQLSPAEQEKLFYKASQGDKAGQDRLVAIHLPMVVRLATARSGEGLSIPDLVQEGSIGLLVAVKTFAASGEVDFDAFAESRIAAQLTAAIEAEAASVRDAKLLVTAAEDYDRTEIVLRRELHREPTEAEFAEKLEWTLERTRYVAQVVAEARRRHDEELLAFIDPDLIELDSETDLDGDDDELAR
jgi:RNA polymerase sigma factor (sigma-70 family)